MTEDLPTIPHRGKQLKKLNCTAATFSYFKLSLKCSFQRKELFAFSNRRLSENFYVSTIIGVVSLDLTCSYNSVLRIRKKWLWI